MDYARLIATAWHMTWRHRFLWVLALFAGGLGPGFFGGSNTGQIRWNTNSDELRRIAPQAGDGAAEAGRWLAANQGIVVVAVLAIFAIAILLVIIALICQGAVARATADLARGEPITLGEAWTAGLHLFGRYVGLWLTLIAVSIGVAALIAVVAFIVFGPLPGSAGPSPVAIGLAITLGIPLFILLLAVSVVVSVIVAFAQRAIAVQEVGPIEALGLGWNTFRSHPGESLLTWLVCVALTLGVELAAGAIMVVVIGVLAAVGVGFWALAGLTAPTIAYIVVGGIAAIAVGLTLCGIGSAFFWSYWTLAYLHLTGAITVLQSAPRPSPPQLSQVPPTA